MTHSGGKPHAVGDQGQRYEMSFFNGEERQVMGWANDSEIARKMGDSIDKHPTWTLPQLRDRAYDEYGKLYGEESEPHPHHCGLHCWYANRPCIHCAAAEDKQVQSDD